MPESTLQSAAHKIGLDHFFLVVTEIVHPSWCRKFSPIFSSLHFVGAWLSIQFTLVGTLLVSENSLLGKRTSWLYEVLLYLSWIMLFSLFTYHQHRIIQAGRTITVAWYLSTYLQKKGIQCAALDLGLRFCQAGRAQGFQTLENNTRLISCQAFGWMPNLLLEANFWLESCILMPRVALNTTHGTSKQQFGTMLAALPCDILIPYSVCQICLVALRFSSSTEQFDFCSPPGVFPGIRHNRQKWPPCSRSVSPKSSCCRLFCPFHFQTTHNSWLW